jgi:hypothetical protein
VFLVHLFGLTEVEFKFETFKVPILSVLETVFLVLLGAISTLPPSIVLSVTLLFSPKKVKLAKSSVAMLDFTV